MVRVSIVATPIGNMNDITLRALETLRKADVILCEDTRETRKILSLHNIGTQTLSYHAHSDSAKVDHIINLLEEGKNLAVVSDAGTPGISDPGAELVARIRSYSLERVGRGLEPIHIEAIPGASALTAALSIAGVPTAPSVFFGFAPHKKGRETLWKTIMTEVIEHERTCIFYESTHRIEKALASLALTFGEKSVTVTLVKEITKMFENVIQGTPQQVAQALTNNSDLTRGEFVVIVSPAQKS